MPKPKILTESAVTKIVTTIPEVRDRVRMFQHLSLTKMWEGSEVSVSADEELERVVEWIYETNPSDTVRAKYARKIAKQLESKDHRK